jgi:hypothetical protein
LPRLCVIAEHFRQPDVLNASRCYTAV